MDIQQGEHSSVEDAWMAMLLYKRYKKEWELSLSGQKKKVEDEDVHFKIELKKDVNKQRRGKPKIALWKRKKMQKERAMQEY